MIGFDINVERIDALRIGKHATQEVSADDLCVAKHLTFNTDLADLAAAFVYMVMVPKPIDANKRPDLIPLIKALEPLSHVLKRGDIVIYESTVYASAAEADCVPVLERVLGSLRGNRVWVWDDNLSTENGYSGQ
ncbi:UDP-glucose/GDP-mannose dehydrogenase [Roseobacter sp. AzwK-3b]|uniref:UDP-glucose/GDP-mannose dehydrogenase n=1 Tax=Roseobacter sp. AzwK-3b TaxID=351016 RepID=UPI000156A97C|nr:UDP-glucose/GDP-mannose dehydrogenase [Roseobacter sp. AzwK-3b]EDM69925.1 UDP-glucose/GDP-mannose dehydrogenase [Roseobacter sp. AzwK-3b]